MFKQICTLLYRTARFCAITVCFASLAVNTKHAIRQALVDRKIHHDLNILLASNCDYAKFHAGLALAVLVNDPHLRPNINFTSQGSAKYMYKKVQKKDSLPSYEVQSHDKGEDKRVEVLMFSNLPRIKRTSKIKFE